MAPGPLVDNLASRKRRVVEHVWAKIWTYIICKYFCEHAWGLLSVQCHSGAIRCTCLKICLPFRNQLWQSLFCRVPTARPLKSAKSFIIAAKIKDWKVLKLRDMSLKVMNLWLVCLICLKLCSICKEIYFILKTRLDCMSSFTLTMHIPGENSPGVQYVYTFLWKEALTGSKNSLIYWKDEQLLDSGNPDRLGAKLCV